MTYLGETATDWHDLEDLLTPDQIRDMNLRELRSNVSEESGHVLTALARSYVGENLYASVIFGHLPEPAGVEYFYCHVESKPGVWSRQFVCAVLDPEDAWEVTIGGTQYSDGGLERRLLVGGEDTPPGGDTTGSNPWVEFAFAADAGRRLSNVLAHAVHEMDRPASGSEYRVGDCTVIVKGSPSFNGRRERLLLIRGYDAVLPEMAIELAFTAEVALRLAAALAEGADEINRLAQGSESPSGGQR